MKYFTKLVYDPDPETFTAPMDEDNNYIGRYRYTICRWCFKIISTPLFDTFVMLIIISSTIILATDKHTEDCIDYKLAEELKRAGKKDCIDLELCYDLITHTNDLFTALFASECILKLIGLRFYEWRSDFFNVCDLFIVLTSVFEGMAQHEKQDMISALRALRLFRLIKLVRNNYTLRCLLDSIAETLSQVANFMVILAIFIYVFSLLGMEIFAGKFMFDKDGNFDAENGELSRQNYDEILWAIVTVF